MVKSILRGWMPLGNPISTAQESWSDSITRLFPGRDTSASSIISCKRFGFVCVSSAFVVGDLTRDLRAHCWSTTGGSFVVIVESTESFVGIVESADGPCGIADYLIHNVQHQNTIQEPNGHAVSDTIKHKEHAGGQKDQQQDVHCLLQVKVLADLHSKTPLHQCHYGQCHGNGDWDYIVSKSVTFPHRNALSTETISVWHGRGNQNYWHCLCITWLSTSKLDAIDENDKIL